MMWCGNKLTLLRPRSHKIVSKWFEWENDGTLIFLNNKIVFSLSTTCFSSKKKKKNFISTHGSVSYKCPFFFSFFLFSFNYYLSFFYNLFIYLFSTKKKNEVNVSNFSFNGVINIFAGVNLEMLKCASLWFCRRGEKCTHTRGA